MAVQMEEGQMSTTGSTLTHLECSNCGATYDAAALHTTCRACGKVLFAQYDLAAARRSLTPASLRERPFTLWRYRELLPVQSADNITTLGEGGTPLLAAPRLGAALDCRDLFVKDEGLNPTASFKARGLSATPAPRWPPTPPAPGCRPTSSCRTIRRAP
jgi:threonine synthase